MNKVSIFSPPIKRHMNRQNQSDKRFFCCSQTVSIDNSNISSDFSISSTVTQKKFSQQMSVNEQCTKPLPVSLSNRNIIQSTVIDKLFEETSA